MSYVAMTNLSPYDQLTAAEMDKIRGNIEHLHDPPYDASLGNSSDYSTTSTTFVDVDATNLALSVDTTGGPLLVVVLGRAGMNGVGSLLYFDLEVDGTRIGTTSPTGIGLWSHVSPAANEDGELCIPIVVPGLAAGTHTIKLQWHVSSTTGYLRGGQFVARMWGIGL